MEMSTPQVSRRQFLGGSAALLAMMGVGGLAGCSGGNGGSGSGAATGGIELTDTFTMISVAGNDSFDPIVGTGADKVTMHSLYDNLFMFDGEGNVEPMLVDTYEQEGNVVTATLREANFSDGNPVTADDVVYSWDMLRADPSQGSYMSNYITDVEKVDDKTVKITVVRDDTSWLNILAETIYIIPNGSYDPEANDYASTPMIGSGAYVFESVDEARTVTLKANEDYWGGAPTFKTVVVQAPVDSSTSLVALQNGEVNCVSMMAQTAVETAREDANLNVVEFEAWGQQMLGVLVGDQAFRSAIFHAINTQNIVDVVTGGAATPATQFFAKKLLGEDYDGVVTFEAYDPDLAKEELAKSETDLSQTFVITASDEAGAQCAQCIQQDLSAIGINVEVESVDTNTWSSKLIEPDAPDVHQRARHRHARCGQLHPTAVRRHLGILLPHLRRDEGQGCRDERHPERGGAPRPRGRAAQRYAGRVPDRAAVRHGELRRVHRGHRGLPAFVRRYLRVLPR